MPPPPAFRFVDGFARSARLVLDVRDWYAATFRPDAARRIEVPKPGGGAEQVVVRAVVRPTGAVALTAGRASPADPWPFRGEVELVTAATPSGLLAFFGRVRTAGGPLLRLPLAGAVATLTVRCGGYEPAVLPRVRIPARDDPTETLRVELAPGPDLPPGPTGLAGGVFAADGKPRAAVVTVRAPGAGEGGADLPLATAEADAMGLWRAELKGLPDGDPPLVVADVRSGGVTERLGPVAVRRGRANRLPQTVLRGSVWLPPVRPGDHRPAGGAEVSLAEVPGASTAARPDGTWVYYPPQSGPDWPLAGDKPVTVRVRVAAGGPAVEHGYTIRLGEPNTIPAIQV